MNNIFRRSFLYYTQLIEKLLPGSYKNNDFGSLPYYIVQLQLIINNYIKNAGDEEIEVVIDLLNQPNIIGWYFLLDAIEVSNNDKLLDIIEEFAMMKDGVVYHTESPKMDIFAMLDLLTAKIKVKNSVIEIKSPPKYHDLRNKATRTLIKSNRELPDSLDMNSIFEYKENLSVKNLETIINDRRCCLMNGKNGDSYCNICGKIIPEEYKLSENSVNG